MRLMKFAAAAALCASAMAFGGTASAQPDRHWDRGHHNGWNPDRDSRWGRHHRANRWHHRHCQWRWRHHHRVRVCW